MPQSGSKVLLVLLILSLSSLSIELSFITSAIIIFLCTTRVVNYNALIFGLLIIIITFIGLISTNWTQYPPYDLLKDFIYFTRPIAVLYSSYFIIKRMKTPNEAFNIVVVIGLFFAIYHLFVLIYNLNSINTYLDIRRLGGKHNHIELVALIFLLFTPYVSVFKRYNKLIILTIVISIVLYFSRTMIVVLFIFYLGHKGFLFLNRRLIRGVMVFGLISILIGVLISNIETTRDSVGIRKFIYKTQNSFNELFESIDVDKIKRDRRMLWEHWRAYEAAKAIEQIDETGFKAWLIGMGFGTKVELDTNVKLEGIEYTEVPSIHNGYIYVFYKTGILGLLFYIMFILGLFLQYQKFKVDEGAIINKLIVSTSLYLLFTSFVVTGFFRAGEFSMFLFGLLLASKVKFEKANQLRNNFKQD